MRSFMILFVVITLVACVPSELRKVDLPATAGRFAKISFSAGIVDVRGTMVALLDETTGGFSLTGSNESKTVFSAFWIKVAGQPVRTYFVFEGNAQTALVRVFTEPTPPTTPKLFVSALQDLADAVQSKLGNPKFKLEPDP
jgi:hypothetical protein